MFIKNSFKLSWLVLGSLINIAQIIYLYPLNELTALFVFYLAILLNQLFLFIFVADLTGMKANTTALPTWFYGFSKMLLLVAAFSFALSQTVGRELYLVWIYIFQLLILAISIKRIVKKT